MKFYSEELEALYDSPEQLEAAEKAAAAKKAAEEARRKQQIENNVKLKKELAGAIDAADETLNLAYKHLADTKAECKKLADETNAKIREMLNAARKSVTDAEKARVNAISEFNKKFGPFQKCYSGDKAKEELQRMNSIFDELFGMFI